MTDTWQGLWLARATLLVYLDAARDAWRGLRRNWYWSLLLLVDGVAVIPLSMLAGALLGPTPGGFALGLFWTLVLANIFAIVEATVRSQRLSLRELWQETKVLFFPVMGVLFVLFGVQLALGLLAGQPEHEFMRILLSGAILICFNALPEVLYQQRLDSLSTYRESLEFLKDNGVEFLLVQLVLLLPLFLVAPAGVILAGLSRGPLDFPVSVAVVAGSFFVYVFSYLPPLVRWLLFVPGAVAGCCTRA